jgi:hypothetical protein
MRPRRRLLGLCAAVAMAATAGASLSAEPARTPGWRVYADCAAAYLANARVADPDRPAAMTAQVSDVANDYEAAARTRYGRGRGAEAKVHARIERQARAFAARPREVNERAIDACPQVGG